tara:strand:+ start:336 stop:752 length:417 start_codon:yes stop_codon:yes gene_type:complete
MNNQFMDMLQERQQSAQNVFTERLDKLIEKIPNPLIRPPNGYKHVKISFNEILKHSNVVIECTDILCFTNEGKEVISLFKKDQFNQHEVYYIMDSYGHMFRDDNTREYFENIKTLIETVYQNKRQVQIVDKNNLCNYL